MTVPLAITHAMRGMRVNDAASQDFTLDVHAEQQQQPAKSHTHQLKRLSQTLYGRGFLDGLFSDITVKVREVEFKLHQIVLISNDYFASMLQGPWREARSCKETNDTAKVITIHFNDENITIEAVTTFSENIVGAAITKLCAKGSCELLDILPMLSLTWLARIVSLDSFFCTSEFERYQLVSKTIAAIAANQNNLHTEDGQPDESVEMPTATDDQTSDQTSDDRDELSALDILQHSIHYSQIPFFQLKSILRDAIVPKALIHDAAWRQRELEQLILTSEEDCKELGIAAEMCELIDTEHQDDCDDTSSQTLHKIHSKLAPIGDTDLIDKHLLMPALESPLFPHMDDIFPPFRFGCEFKNLDVLSNSRRMFSDAVNYGGLTIRDPRNTVRMWFKLFCFFPESDCFVFESKPDDFSIHQSWGWRSIKLMQAARMEKSQSMRCAVVMGLV
eukprot:jgi/Hompol1/6893/HPOL_003542-RA